MANNKIIDLERLSRFKDNLENNVDGFFSERSNNPIKNKVISQKVNSENWVSAFNINKNKIQDVQKNILTDNITITDGYYYSNDTPVQNANSCYTDYVYIEPNTVIKVIPSFPETFSNLGCLYDENKNFISNVYQLNIDGEQYITRSTQIFTSTSPCYIRFNIPVNKKSVVSFVSIKSIYFDKENLNWLGVKANNIDLSKFDDLINISKPDGTPIIPFIRNHGWLKNGTLYTSANDFGSTVTIPINRKVKKITLLPYYKYNQENNVDFGAFVNESGTYLSGLFENGTWVNDNTLFEINVPDNVYGIQLNATFTNDDKYSSATSYANVPSTNIYMIQKDGMLFINWLNVKKDNIDTNNVMSINNISKQDGTPIIEFIRNHMWLKNGTLYTSSTQFVSTKTIPLNGLSSFKLLPYYKYNKENNVDNGAFVNEDGTWFAGLMENAEWDNDHVYLNVNVPSGAYGFQLNATASPSTDTYQTVSSAANNPSSDVAYYVDDYIYVPWLRTSVNWQDIPNDIVSYNSLKNDVKVRLNPTYDDSYKYWDSLNKPFDFQGKTLVAFGDSITDGIANEGSGNYSAGSNSYINLFATKFNMTLNNRAVSGSRFTAGGQYGSITTTITSFTFANTNSEVVIIAGGTNDFNTGAQLGQLGDTTDATFYGALDVVCQYLTTNAPNSTIIFITPINLNKEESSFPNHTNTLNAYRNAIYEVATKYKFNVVDGSSIGFAKKVNTPWGNLMIAPSDGTHPTLAGHSLYFRGLCGKLL